MRRVLMGRGTNRPHRLKPTQLLKPGVAFIFMAAITARAQDPNKPEQPPGEAKSVKTQALETGAEILQSDGPLNAIHAHLCGFHFYAGRPSQQVMAIHYCAGMNEEMRQCIIYDSDRKDARMMGVEYIISERLFNTLPEDEKKLWHSHRYEVQSGQLLAPKVQRTNKTGRHSRPRSRAKAHTTLEFALYDLCLSGPLTRSLDRVAQSDE